MISHLITIDVLWSIIATVFCALLLGRTIYILIATPIIRPSCWSLIKKPSLVSILLPVRNEEKRVLRRNIESLLKQTYKQIQIIAVNDRSTDNSLSILRQYERMPGSTLQVIEGTDVPANWLGKLFALHQAKSHATGEWLLTIDADVIYSPHTVESALAYMEENNLDALSLLPRVKMDSFWETTIIPVMSWLSLMRVSTTQANRRSSKACFGYGNFIIFKRYAHNYIGVLAVTKMTY